MNPTTLLYLKNFTLLECDAKILERTQENGKDILILDETVFYPQGGGQPYDTGVIESPAGKFLVEEVRFIDGVVHHIGRFESGAFAIGDPIHCIVDAERRLLHSRIHSAGHLVDFAVSELGLPWTPGKGYHFPQGPYVEYGDILGKTDKEKLKADIERIARDVIQNGKEVTARFMEKSEMTSVCRFVPDNIPAGKPGRVVIFGGNFGVLPPRQNPGEFLTLARATHGSLNSPVKLHFTPCGGTHVKNLSEIRGLTIRKIKQEGQNIRVGYDVAE